MDVLNAIKTRRSIGKVKPDPVPKEMVETILEAGTWAPCHHQTEPWRFFVLTGDARKGLGNIFAQIAKGKMTEPISEEDQKRLEREHNKPLRAPVIITVAVEPSDNSKVFIQEEFAAVHAAVQNILLAAHSLGLGAVWRTGGICYEPEVKQFFGLTGKSELVGFIYIGYPDMNKVGRRKPFSEVTKWME